MPEWLTIVVLTLGAGLAMPLGALLACGRRILPRWLEADLRHTVLAFGGGTLLAALALVLVPEGMDRLPVLPAALCFASGGAAFLLLDIRLSARGTPSGQLAAMLADFVPEAIALGAAFASGTSAGSLLALLIALQNVPEGFNAFREMSRHGSHSPTGLLFRFTAMALLGPVAGLVGYLWLSKLPAVVGALMLFASGGILYLTFWDIAPQAKGRSRHWFPPLGVVAGFLLGMIGKMLL